MLLMAEPSLQRSLSKTFEDRNKSTFKTYFEKQSKITKIIFKNTMLEVLRQPDLKTHH